MTRLRLDFAGRRRSRADVIALTALLLCAATSFAFWSLQAHRLETIEASVEASRARGKQATSVAGGALDARQRGLREAQLILGFPLAPALKTLQPAGTSVSLVGVELVTTRNNDFVLPRLRVTGQADALIAVADYLADLTRSAGVAEARLVRHEYIADRSPTVIQFVIELTWTNNAGT